MVKMARSYQKNILRTFKGSRSRFVAIFAIVALGVGFLAGLLSTTPDMEDSMEEYLDAGNLFDLRVVSTLGLTDDDVQALRQVDGVDEVQPAYSADLLIQDASAELVGRVHSLTDDPEGADVINRLTLTEGRWPQADNECVVEEGISTLNKDFAIGDTLVVDPENEDLEDTLSQTEFTIVGKVHNTYYFSYEREPASVGSGAVDIVLYVKPDAFAYDSYTELYLTVSGASRLASLEDEYTDLVSTVADRIESIEDVRCEARYTQVVSDAQAEIDDAWQEYYDGKAEADEELADAAQELEDGRKELAEGEQEYQDGEQEYSDGLAEVQENEQKIADGEVQLADGLQELQEKQAEYDDAVAKLADGEKQLADGKAQLDAAQKKYDDGLAQYQAGLAQYEDGKRLYDAGAAEYEEGVRQFEQLKLLNQAQNGLTAGVQTIIDLGYAGSEEEARALFSDEGLVETGTAIDQLNQLAQLRTREQEAKQAYDEALAAAEEEADAEPGTDPVPDPSQQGENGTIVTEPGNSETEEPAEATEEPADGKTIQEGTASGEDTDGTAAETKPAEPETAGQTADPETTGQMEQETKAEAAEGTETASAAAGTPAGEPSAPEATPEADPTETSSTGEEQLQNTADEKDTGPDTGNQPETKAHAAPLGVTGDTENVSDVEAAKEAWDEARNVWLLALKEAAKTYFGIDLDIGNPLLVALAEQKADKEIAELPDMQQQYEQLKQLNTAQHGLETGVQAILDAGYATTEEEAYALFSDEAIAATEAKLEAGRIELEENAALLDATEQQLADAKKELDDGKAQLDSGWEQYNTQGAAFYEGKRQLEDGKRQLDDGWATLTDKQVELNDAKRQIADAYAELDDARAELDDARQTIAENRQKLADGEIEYADAKADAEQELADARAEIEDAQSKVDEIEYPSWYVWDRDDNVSFSSFRGNVSKVEALSGVFPIFFFLVAALVVSTTMTRMVEEERLQIGTMKALGYSNHDIMRKYILYAMTAAVSGALVGLAVGFTVFPSVIWYAYAMMYYVPEFHAVWRWNYAIFSSGLLIGSALLVTWTACRNSLKETPADLMRPRAPKAGKRIFLEYIRPLWKRLSFTQKVTCRNLFRYKKRFWMTVIGVAGCTALLVTGFGISDSINGIIVKQYRDVDHYDLMTAVTDAEDTQQGEIHDYLFGDDAFPASLATLTEKTTQELSDGSSAEVYMMVPQDVEEFAQFYDLHERVSRKATPLGETGIVMTEKLAELMDAKTGDTVTLVNADGEEAEFTISGICENYVSNYVYLSADTYTQAFGEEPQWNVILSRMADTSQASRDAVSAVLLGMEDVASVTFTVDTTTSVLNMLNSINAVVVMIVICAAVLALVVLYNLTNINIAERVKEIATIKVLGFYDREVSAYVMRESIALTVIGALFGMVGGIALHRFVIYTVEVDAVMFGRTIDFSSFVYALGLTILFSLIVNLYMGRKLKKISMVESMKAPE